MGRNKFLCLMSPYSNYLGSISTAPRVSMEFFFVFYPAHFYKFSQNFELFYNGNNFILDVQSYTF